MFILNARSEMEFKGGKSAWAEARQIALSCRNFKEDIEEEQVADEAVSCYNCRYRRWTRDSFVCCKK